MKIRNLEELGPYKPNETLVKLTELVLAQNQKILDMNADLLKVLMYPVFLVEAEKTREEL